MEDSFTFELPGYPAFRINALAFLATARGAKCNPDKIPYDDRIYFLGRVEDLALGMARFVDNLLNRSAEAKFNKYFIRHVPEGLDKYNPIKVSCGTFGEVILSGPVMGTRRGTNDTLDNMVERAINAARKRNGTLSSFEEGTIIVKQFGDVNKMRMCTLENREIHATVDAIVRNMQIDDKPAFINTVYVWCASPIPRTEIVVVDKYHTYLYDDYIYTLEEDDFKPQYGRHRAERKAFCRVLEKLEAFITEHDSTIGVDAKHYSKESADTLVKLYALLSELIVKLRAPYVTDGERNSQQYRRGKGHTHRAYEKYRFKALLKTEDNSERVAGLWPTKITLYSDAPAAFYNLTAKMISDFQEEAFMLHTGWVYNGQPLHPKGTGLLELDVVRKIREDDLTSCDADNINVEFIRRWGSRVRIIRSRSAAALDKYPDAGAKISLSLASTAIHTKLKP